MQNYHLEWLKSWAEECTNNKCHNQCQNLSHWPQSRRLWCRSTWSRWTCRRTSGDWAKWLNLPPLNFSSPSKSLIPEIRKSKWELREQHEIAIHPLLRLSKTFILHRSFSLENAKELSSAAGRNFLQEKQKCFWIETFWNNSIFEYKTWPPKPIQATLIGRLQAPFLYRALYCHWQLSLTLSKKCF